MAERLHPDDVRAVAAAVVDEMEARGLTVGTPTAWLTAEEVGRHWGLTADYVREHAADYGGERVGSGQRPRWRFPSQATAGTFGTGKASDRARKRELPGKVAVRGADRAGTRLDLVPVSGLSTSGTPLSGPGDVGASRGLDAASERRDAQDATRRPARQRTPARRSERAG